MRVGIFIAPGSLAGVGGRQLASLAFIDALATTGRVDLTLFTDAPTPYPAITTAPITALPDALTRLDVIHDLGYGFLPQLAELRNYLGAKTRVTGHLHSLAAPAYWTFLRDPVLTENDAVFNASTPYLDVFTRIATAAGSRLRQFLTPLGIDSTCVPTTTRLPEIEALLDRRANTVVVATLGRFSRLSKQDLAPLRDALTQLQKELPGLDLVHLAAGVPTGEGYEHEIATWPRTVVFDARTIATRRNQLFACADVFVAPTTNVQESFGLAPIEAMACGLPVVATAFSGHQDTVTPEVGALVAALATPTPPDLRTAALVGARAYFTTALGLGAVAPAALANALRPLVGDAQLRSRCSTHAIARGRTYHWPHRIGRFLDCWAELVATPFVPPTCVPNLDHAAVFASCFAKLT